MTDNPALAAVAFWFLRHGQTDWNKHDLAQGTVDVPLNQTGLDQAAQAAALLQGRGIARIVSSPLIRARVTADIVAARLGLPVEVEPLLHEAAFGQQEGQNMLAPWFAEWIQGRATPPGAEPFAAVTQRAVQAVNRALQGGPGPTLVIAHGALFRGLRAAMGLPPNERLPNAVPQFCEPATPWRLTTCAAPG
jgi:probable phosphoglycerate mutase